MDKFYDFMSAALPWIAMELLLAIFFARTANGTKKEEDHGSEGMALGMCLGAAIATALHRDIGLGLSLGMLLGSVIGASMEKKNDDEGNHDD